MNHNPDITLLEDILDDYLDDTLYTISFGIDKQISSIFISIRIPTNPSSEIFQSFFEFKESLPQYPPVIPYWSMPLKFLKVIESTDLFKRIYKLISYKLHDSYNTWGYNDPFDGTVDITNRNYLVFILRKDSHPPNILKFSSEVYICDGTH